MANSNLNARPPRLGWREREARRVRGAVLDPGLVAPGEASPTLYEADVLLITAQAQTTQRGTAAAPTLDSVAAGLGWVLTPEDLEDPVPPRGGGKGVARSAASGRRRGTATTRRVRIALAQAAPSGKPETPPDAWRLLVEARRKGITGLGLNHILTTDALGSNPFTGNPFTGNPFTGNPFTGNPFTGNPFTGNPAGMGGYAYPGLGGRQPVAYVGPDLPQPRLAEADRPVVAILDTGCGEHPWLKEARINPAAVYGGEIGIIDGTTDPEAFTSLDSPLDGVVDSAAGHGTFIAGLVLQACPEARILPVRVADSQGVILENDLLGALGRLVALIDDGFRLDVVNLSFSYYHESPQSESIDSELYELLTQLRERGCVIVCSAGNDATDRPASPASLHHWVGADCGIAPEGDIAPLVTVGALNPSGRSVALFSNIGAWVQTYVRGVSVLSTIPTSFQGGVQADLRSDEYDRQRETLDLDDFQSGFAVWSGTSFAAPVIAGRIAAKLAGPRPKPDPKKKPIMATSHIKATVKACDGVVADSAKEDRSTLR